MRHSHKLDYGKVRLRPLAHGDIEQLRLWRNDPANSRFIRKLPEITPQMQEEWFASYLEDPSCITFAVEDVGGELVGSVSLYELQGNHAEFGRLMIGSKLGQGLGTEAADACLTVAFSSMDMLSLHATVTVDNTAALIIYVRLGFVITGRQYNESIGADEFTIDIQKDRYMNLKSLRGNN